MKLLVTSLSGLLLLAVTGFAAPTIDARSQAVLGVPQRPTDSSKPVNNSRPLVLWHGLGDTAHSPGILGFIKDVKHKFPGIYVHSVKIPKDGTFEDERRAGFVSGWVCRRGIGRS
jgi:palmitoyl-protein thioesterase